MSDVVIPVMKEGRKNNQYCGMYYFKFPKSLFGMVGTGKRFYLKTYNRGVAQERLAAVIIMAQLADPQIREF